MKTQPQLVIEAALAIEKFKRTHDEACVLLFTNGVVIAKPPKSVKASYHALMQITEIEQRKGFTRGRWTLIGLELNKQQKKENLCAPDPKPSTSPNSTLF